MMLYSFTVCPSILHRLAVGIALYQQFCLFQVQAFGQLLGAPTLENCIRQPSTMAAVEGCFQISPKDAVHLANKLTDLKLPAKAYSPSNSSTAMRMMIVRREV